MMYRKQSIKQTREFTSALLKDTNKVLVCRCTEEKSSTLGCLTTVNDAGAIIQHKMVAKEKEKKERKNEREREREREENRGGVSLYYYGVRRRRNWWDNER